MLCFCHDGDVVTFWFDGDFTSLIIVHNTRDYYYRMSPLYQNISVARTHHNNVIIKVTDGICL